MGSLPFLFYILNFFTFSIVHNYYVNRKKNNFLNLSTVFRSHISNFFLWLTCINKHFLRLQSLLSGGSFIICNLTCAIYFIYSFVSNIYLMCVVVGFSNPDHKYYKQNRYYKNVGNQRCNNKYFTKRRKNKTCHNKAENVFMKEMPTIFHGEQVDPRPQNNFSM